MNENTLEGLDRFCRVRGGVLLASLLICSVYVLTPLGDLVFASGSMGALLVMIALAIAVLIVSFYHTYLLRGKRRALLGEAAGRAFPDWGLEWFMAYVLLMAGVNYFSPMMSDKLMFVLAGVVALEGLREMGDLLHRLSGQESPAPEGEETAVLRRWGAVCGVVLAVIAGASAARLLLPGGMGGWEMALCWLPAGTAAVLLLAFPCRRLGAFPAASRSQRRWKRTILWVAFLAVLVFSEVRYLPHVTNAGAVLVIILTTALLGLADVAAFFRTPAGHQAKH